MRGASRQNVGSLPPYPYQGIWSHKEQVSLKVIITFVLGFALAFAAGWYLSASLPHSGR